MLSARGEEYDKLHGFELGVDDYVVKPFSPRELMMRIDAIMKRAGKKENEHKIYQKDGLKIGFTARKVYVDDKDVNLTPKEYDLLFYMAETGTLRCPGKGLYRQSGAMIILGTTGLWIRI